MALPKWMRQAIKDNVINEAEAQEIHRVVQASTEELVTMPEHLHPALERVHLWEMETEATLH